MVVFDDNQFEIAIATYKRTEFIQSWLEKCYQPSIDRNIKLSIYDSSPDENTKLVVDKFNRGKESKVEYRHVDASTVIGYKPMIPILETKSEFLWVAGDSRCHNFDELDEKVFPYIKEKKTDYIVINVSNNFQLPDTVYVDKGKMIHDTFVASTCIGLSIYRVAIFDILKSNPELMTKCDKLFRNNYGFGWLGYFYHVYSCGEYKTLLVNVGIMSVLNKKKTQSWVVRFYGCWVEDLCQIVDNIPDNYKGKNNIPRNTWDVMKLDSFSYGYLARKHGDLNKEKYDQLICDGMLERITDNPARIKFFATVPMLVLEIDNILHIAIGYGIRVYKRIVRKLCGRK